MNQPQAFREFATYCFYAEEVEPDMSYQDAIIEEAYVRLSAREKAEVQAYLDHLLTGGYTDQELWDIWSRSGAGIAFFPSPRPFLVETRQMMARVG